MLGFGLHKRCARHLGRRWGVRGAGKSVWVRVWGLWFASGVCYLQVFVCLGNWLNLLWRRV